jgi:hypothetical protein
MSKIRADSSKTEIRNAYPKRAIAKTMDKQSDIVNALFRITIFVVKLGDFVYSQLYYFLVAPYGKGTVSAKV